MMDTIKVLDRHFTVSIPHEEIQARVQFLAEQINEEFRDKNPIFLSVLNGAFMFTSDLMKHIMIDCEVQFVKMKSYQGMDTTNEVKTLMGVTQDITNRHVIIVEDIVDTGNTMEELIRQLSEKNPEDVKICTLLYKPEKFQKDFKIDYEAFRIPNDFVVGYGLDYDGVGRNFKDIYTVVE